MKVKKLDLVAIVISVLLVHISLIQRITSWQGFYYIRWGNGDNFISFFTIKY
jgi:hypothetical protein